MTENEISTLVVDAAIEVHRVLGSPGLLEGVYEEALAWELTSRGLMVERQKEVPIRYKVRVLGHPLKFDYGSTAWFLSSARPPRITTSFMKCSF